MLAAFISSDFVHVIERLAVGLVLRPDCTGLGVYGRLPEISLG